MRQVNEQESNYSIRRLVLMIGVDDKVLIIIVRIK